MEYQGILNVEQDMAQKWRVWVDVGNDELLMLKFQKKPTEEQIKIEINKAIQNQQIET